MPVTSDGRAPYAPADPTIGLIERYREHGLTPPINTTVLERAGINDSLIPRTLQALRILDLIDKDGNPTESFDILAKAPGPEYKERLAEWLRTAYAPIFAFCDPATNPERVEDAFRGYTPAGQRSRMVTLFMGLCAHAGILPADARKKASGDKPRYDKPKPKKDAAASKADGPGGQDAFKPTDPPPSDVRDRYVSMLIERAEQSDDLESDLLDRIERALGIAPTSTGGSS